MRTATRKARNQNRRRNTPDPPRVGTVAFPEHEYSPLPEPRPVSFCTTTRRPTEGQAIATNSKGMVRVVWGENQESDVPKERITWLDEDVVKVFDETEEFTVALTNGWIVRVEYEQWDSGSHGFQFRGAVSPTGFHSDYASDQEIDIREYATRRAQELFENLPKDVDGLFIFDGDRCEILRGKHKGTIEAINGCVFEGRMSFKDYATNRLGQHKPSNLRRVGQGETSLEILGESAPGAVEPEISPPSPPRPLSQQSGVSVRIADILIEPELQMRACFGQSESVQEATVEDYMQVLEGGESLSPVILFQVGDALLLADGFHTLAAHKRLGRQEIEARIIEGTTQDAIWYAIQANAKHGLSMTREDKQRAIIQAVRHFPQKSDREIARAVGCDNKTVGAWRLKLAESEEIPQMQTRVIQRGSQTYEQQHQIGPSLEEVQKLYEPWGEFSATGSRKLPFKFERLGKTCYFKSLLEAVAKQPEICTQPSEDRRQGASSELDGQSPQNGATAPQSQVKGAVPFSYTPSIQPPVTCALCQHRQLIGDGSEYECKAKGP
ncbi:MAG: hypothetical protein WCA35_12200, partial [Kovacikia sp.]